MLTVQRQRALQAVIVCLLLSFSAAGCKRVAIPHPNAINSFDSSAYDTLIVAKAALTQAKAELSKFPQYKEQLNQGIAAYNAAESEYRTWRTAKINGIDTPEDADKLKASLIEVGNNIKNLVQLFGLDVTPISGGVQ